MIKQFKSANRVAPSYVFMKDYLAAQENTGPIENEKLSSAPMVFNQVKTEIHNLVHNDWKPKKFNALPTI